MYLLFFFSKWPYGGWVDFEAFSWSKERLRRVAIQKATSAPSIRLGNDNDNDFTYVFVGDYRYQIINLLTLSIVEGGEVRELIESRCEHKRRMTIVLRAAIEEVAAQPLLASGMLSVPPVSVCLDCGKSFYQ